MDVIIESNTALESVRDRSVNELNVSALCVKAFEAHNINTIRQLEAMTANELKRLKGPRPCRAPRPLGLRQVRHVQEVLASLGLKLKGDS